MAKQTNTSFRLDQPFLDYLDWMAAAFGVSKTYTVRSSALIVGALFKEARRNALADLAALRERYGEGAELICGVDIGADGLPIGRVIIDGESPADVAVRPYTDPNAGLAHIFLIVDRERGEAPNIVPFGNEILFLDQPLRMPIGSLPWPPKKGVGLKIRLGELTELLLEEKPDRAQPMEV